MAKILVTGGAGFIGSHLVKKLTDEDHQVLVLDAFNQYIQPPITPHYVYNLNHRFENLLNKADIIRCDTKNKDDLRRRVSNAKPDYIVHFAALPLANMAIEYTEEAFNTIVGGTVNLLEVLRDSDDSSKFVYISSSMVYGDFESIPIPEDAKKEPKEIYGGMKLAGEYMVKTYSQRYDIRYSIVRPSAVYGPTDNNRRVLGLFLTNAITGNKIRVKNGDSTELDFTYVDDVVQGIKLVTLSSASDNRTFNITKGKSKTLNEVVEVIKSKYPNTEVEYIEGETFRPSRGALDITRAKQLLDFYPKYDIEEGINMYAEYLEPALNQV